MRSLTILAILAALFAGACGIPTTQFIGAPDETDPDFHFTSIPPTVTFPHNTSDNSTENFLGYEVYYRFYKYSTEPGSGEFGTDYATISGAPAGTGLSTVQSKFFRVWREGDTTGAAPLIAISDTDNATEFNVSLVFPDKPSGTTLNPATASLIDPSTGDPSTVQIQILATGEVLGTTIEIVRQRDAGQLPAERSFESEGFTIVPGSTELTDPDLPDGLTVDDTVLHMAIVILGYGIDYTGNTFAPLYSDPIILDSPLEIVLQ